jgi:hypothetical protein
MRFVICDPPKQEQEPAVELWLAPSIEEGAVVLMTRKEGTLIESDILRIHPDGRIEIYLTGGFYVSQRDAQTLLASAKP